jgi:hypothetical protein
MSPIADVKSKQPAEQSWRRTLGAGVVVCFALKGMAWLGLAWWAAR